MFVAPFTNALQVIRVVLVEGGELEREKERCARVFLNSLAASFEDDVRGNYVRVAGDAADKT